jgi:DNA-binding NtrC family response regulator
MMKEGYHVREAKNGQEVLKEVYTHERLDLLILDPDLPDVSTSTILEKLENRIPELPVVIHAFPADYSDDPDILKKVPFVEKGGDSIEHLKSVVCETLSKCYPPKYHPKKGIEAPS